MRKPTAFIYFKLSDCGTSLPHLGSRNQCKNGFLGKAVQVAKSAARIAVQRSLLAVQGLAVGVRGTGEPGLLILQLEGAMCGWMGMGSMWEDGGSAGWIGKRGRSGHHS